MVNKLVVSIADMCVSKDPSAFLITYSLGSCIGVSIYDPVVKVGGLLHLMLPESKIAPDKAEKNPCMFADTGVPVLFKEAYKYGADKKRIIIKIAGGAQVMDASGFFNIGKRNYMALRKIFWKNGVLINNEDIGGNVNRTMRLEIATGRLCLKVSDKGEIEL